jgi:GR25 family glycosyltransferase involved in LPS biosynthesis
MTTPVLFLIFNRPEVAVQSFACIRRARPPRLYIAADGPRADRPGEEELCMQTRSIVAAVDWPCSVKTLFHKHNLGCAKGVSAAITWFFQHEDEGIILEDDIVTHPDFFSFCEAMLARYRHDERVMHISGMNMQFGIKRGDASYYFSEIMHCWGWASWRRAWRRFDYSVHGLSGFIKNDLPKKFTSPAVVAHFQAMLRNVRNNTIDTWDTRWHYSIWHAGGLCLQSNVNMIKNIGFSASATHTSGMSLRAFLVPCPMGEIVHTENVVRNEEADALTCRIEFSGVSDSFEVYFNEVLLRLETKQLAEALFLLTMMKKCYGNLPLLIQAEDAIHKTYKNYTSKYKTTTKLNSTNCTTQVPLVFVHVSCENNIEYILRQAIHVNPNRKIILLGDKRNKHFSSFVHWYSLYDYTDGCDDFHRAYKHKSPNSARFELFCFYRWFILKNFMLHHNLPVAFYSDSDNLWYDDIAVYEKAFRNADMATGLHPDSEDDFHYVITPGFTYMNLDCIKCLCGSFQQLYTRELDYIYAVAEEQKAEGGIPSISDMSAIGKFVKDNRKILNILNSLEEIDGGIMDANINSSIINQRRFAMKDGIKDIVFHNGMPTCLELEKNEKYIFHALHFQGIAKNKIPDYYSGPAFESTI